MMPFSDALLLKDSWLGVCNGLSARHQLYVGMQNISYPGAKCAAFERLVFGDCSIQYPAPNARYTSKALIPRSQVLLVTTGSL